MLKEIKANGITKTHKSILVIEDDEKFAELLKLTLRKSGYEVIHVSNGILGLTLNKMGQPDLIISDLAMPLMDGYEMIEKIKENRYLCNIPIIVISGFLGKNVRGESVKGIKADAVFSKPFNMEEFLCTVKRFIKA